jgi:carbon monoxide dehydrogenase subunit G
MEMTGERRIPAPRQQVWDALNDPEVLRTSIPGCESIEREGADQFKARIAVKIGPMAAKFAGKVKFDNIKPPEGYTLTGEGNGGAMGFAKGGADVALQELAAAETLLTYHVKAQVGGKMAQLGARLIDSTAKQMADQFFDHFQGHFTHHEEAAPAAAAAAAPVPNGADRTVTGLPAPENAATYAAAETAAASPAAAVATQERVAAAQQGRAATGTDTEYLRDTAAPGPITQHGAEGASAAGAPVRRPNPRPQASPMEMSPLRMMLDIQPFGLPLQFWIGGVLMLAVLALLFL